MRCVFKILVDASNIWALPRLPFSRQPKISLFSFPLPPLFSFFHLSWVFSWNFGGVFETPAASGVACVSHDNPKTPNVHISGPGALQKHHQNSTRRPQESGRMNENSGRREKKNTKFWAPQQSGVPPFGTPSGHPSGTLLGSPSAGQSSLLVGRSLCGFAPDSVVVTVFAAACVCLLLGRRVPSPLPPLQLTTIFYNQLRQNPPNFHGKTLLLPLPPPLPLSLQHTHLGLNCSGFGPHAFGPPCCCCLCVAAFDLPKCLHCFCYFPVFSCCSCCFSCRFCGFPVVCGVVVVVGSCSFAAVFAALLLLLRVFSGHQPLKNQSLPAFEMCC